MIRVSLLVLVCVVSTLGPCGCTSPSEPGPADSAPPIEKPSSPTVSSVAGSYEIDKPAMIVDVRLNVAEAYPDDAESAVEALEAAEAFVEGMTWTMTLGDDGSASVVMEAMGLEERGTGTWTLRGSDISISLEPSEILPESMSGSVRGDTLELLDPEGGEEKATLFRRLR